MVIPDDIPDHATRTESTFVEIPQYGNPFLGVTLEGNNHEVRALFKTSDGQTVKDVTDEYNAWIATLPHFRKVEFIWELKEGEKDD